MSSSSHQARSTSEERLLSPEIALSATTSPSKLVKVSLVDLRSFTSMPNHVTVILSQVARQFEVEKNTAQAEARELRRKLEDITNQDEDGEIEAPLRKRGRMSDQDPDDSDDGMNEETKVIDAGRHFVILYSPWLRLGEGTFKVEHDPDSEEGERFENGDNKVQGQLREIMKVLGARLSDKMFSETWIAKAVSQPLDRCPVSLQ